MNIRPYEMTDFRAVSELNKQGFEKPSPDSFLLESIEQGRAWVAVEQDAVVGFLIGKLKNNTPYVNNVVVAKAHQRKGIATKLFAKFEEHYGATQKPANKMFWLQVDADNPAQKLYFDLGYRVGWINEHYYGANSHALCMYKSARPFSNSAW
jgi:ribosomal protein S18 acetylase RimI-like enzyme